MKHIVIEANCFFQLDKEEKKDIPECCKFGPGNVSLNCLAYNNDKHQYCPYLAFGTAKASLVLTDGTGEALYADCYWGDLQMSDNEWIKAEQKWVEKQNKHSII